MHTDTHIPLLIAPGFSSHLNFKKAIRESDKLSSNASLQIYFSYIFHVPLKSSPYQIYFVYKVKEKLLGGREARQ